MQAVGTVTPRAVTAADADIASIPRYPCEGAGVVRVGAECTMPGKALTLRFVFWDAVGAFVGASMPFTFTSDAHAEDGALYLGTPSADPWAAVGGPSIFGVHVDAVSGGSWTINPLAQ